MRPLSVLLLAMALCPSAASAATFIYDDGGPAVVLQRWADASYVPVGSGVVLVHRAYCFDGYARACTTAPGDAMWLKAPEAKGLREAFSHELGHRFDYRVMTVDARAQFESLIRDRRPWLAGPNSPHEQFATAYGVCLRHRVISRARAEMGYGYVVTPTSHRRVCRLIRQTAAASATG